MSKYIFICLLIMLDAIGATSQEVMPLYSGAIPNQVESNETESLVHDDIVWIENVQDPSLEIYLPAKRTATGVSVVICPGGGYQGLAYDWEGIEMAKWLNTKGIAAFVLKYRLPISKSITNGKEAPLQDAQRAMQLVRHNAEKWGLDKDKIGIMGFSAGGHLAATLVTNYADIDESSDMELSHVSARPDFAVLVYPVITFTTPHTHMGSRNNLIGEDPDYKLVNYYSNELHVNSLSPPTFLVHSTDDKVVSVENSILFYQALLRAGVYSEMHLYPYGGHGFGLAIGQGHLQGWTDRLDEWLGSLK